MIDVIENASAPLGYMIVCVRCSWHEAAMPERGISGEGASVRPELPCIC